MPRADRDDAAWLHGSDPAPDRPSIVRLRPSASQQHRCRRTKTPPIFGAARDLPPFEVEATADITGETQSGRGVARGRSRSERVALLATARMASQRLVQALSRPAVRSRRALGPRTLGRASASSAVEHHDHGHGGSSAPADVYTDECASTAPARAGV